MTRDETLDALKRCIFIDKDGHLVSKCDDCPMLDEEWKQKGHVCCRAFKELQVSIPYALAEAVMKEMTDSCGQWVVLDNFSKSGIYCSECNKKIFEYPLKPKKKLSNYCPNCGVKNERFFNPNTCKYMD